MNSHEEEYKTIGGEFLLWASDEELRAVRAVASFLYAAEIVLRNAGEDGIYYIGYRELHQHFPHYAQHILPSVMPGHTLYEGRSDETCQAVDLYLRYKAVRGSTLASHGFPLFRLPPPPLPSEFEEKLMKKMERTGVGKPIHYGRLMEVVTETLKKMGALK